ncbi:MAG: ammonia-forming cytochrome c nitrite reductase subunit c552 [Chloroflexi bacterium]|nr:ammonia-forming cytochrome c nitrite reductase subunit c552 [Chloroflexota bacterium]
MKKLLIASLLVVVLLLLAVNVASANGGPHGDYAAATDACAGCHRAHTAKADKLLKEAGKTYDLCISCHGAAGTGANTNVEDGVYLSSRDDAAGDGNHGAGNTPDNSPLLGGGFVNYKGVAVTSTHDPTGVVSGAWGAGDVRGQMGTIDRALDCASCHDPHGSPNYRILKETINGATVSVAQVDEGASKDYDTANWNTDQSNVCGACHNPYQHAGADTTSGTYTHPVDRNNKAEYMPPEYTVGGVTVSVPLAANNYIVCQTCHLPHGTSAQMAGFADGAGPAGDSALLREDNRGVCQACHKK